MKESDINKIEKIIPDVDVTVHPEPQASGTTLKV